MDVEKLIERLRTESLYADKASLEIMDLCMDAAAALSTLQAENEKLRVEAEGMRSNWYKSVEEIKKLRAELENYRNSHCSEGGCAAEKDRDLMIAEVERLRAELEQVKRGNDALWTYIEIVDREYRRYMDRGYIDRLDELKRTWRRGQKED